MVKEKDEAIQRQCNLEKKIHELEKQGTIKIQKKGDGDIAILASAPPTNGLLAGIEGVMGVPGGTMLGPVGPSNGLDLGMSMPPPPPPPPPMPAS
ncbi:formin-like protein 2 isoform X7, partial [Silurus meridionalis]